MLKRALTTTALNAIGISIGWLAVVLSLFGLLSVRECLHYYCWTRNGGQTGDQTSHQTRDQSFVLFSIQRCTLSNITNEGCTLSNITNEGLFFPMKMNYTCIDQNLANLSHIDLQTFNPYFFKVSL